MSFNISLPALLACCFAFATSFPMQGKPDVDFDERSLLSQLLQLQGDISTENKLQNYIEQLKDSVDNGESDFWEEWVDKENGDSKVWDEQNRVETRQHWSDRYRPGGKRSDPFAHSLPMVLRQHWSDWYRPGGKKETLGSHRQQSHNGFDIEPNLLEELKQLIGSDLAAQEIAANAAISNPAFDLQDLPLPRQHWSMAYRPGGKRPASNGRPQHEQQQQQQQHSIQKRQHWSKGLSPGGKRSVDLADFDESGHRIKRDGGMSEATFHVEQPKPAFSKPIEKAESDGKAQFVH